VDLTTRSHQNHTCPVCHPGRIQALGQYCRLLLKRNVEIIHIHRAAAADYPASLLGAEGYGFRAGWFELGTSLQCGNENVVGAVEVVARDKRHFGGNVSFRRDAPWVVAAFDVDGDLLGAVFADYDGVFWLLGNQRRGLCRL